MSDRGIIFSAPMVRALLDGRKTQTRRLCAWANNPNSPQLTFIVACDEPGWFGDEEGEVQFRTFCAPGDRLYVRESGIEYPGRAGGSDLFRHDVPAEEGTGYYWVRDRLGTGASYNVKGCSRAAALAGGNRKVRPSIHMPRWASRLWIAVTDVRVQRLQAITLGDICAEGLAASIYDFKPIQRGFEAWEQLWNGLHTAEGTTWDASPWVVAVTFEVHRGNIDADADRG